MAHEVEPTLQSYSDEIAEIEGLAAQEPENRLRQHDLFHALNKFGNALLEANRLDEALHTYREARARLKSFEEWFKAPTPVTAQPPVAPARAYFGKGPKPTLAGMAPCRNLTEVKTATPQNFGNFLDAPLAFRYI